MPDREKVIKGLKELHGSIETMNLISDTIALLKELQAEIEQLRNDANARRCKDCKHFDYRRLYKCRIHGSLFQPKDGDWFCADFDPSDGAVLEAFAEDG